MLERETSTMPTILGIDLGTTHSLCAVFRNGEATLIPNVHGDYLTPSVVGVLPDGQVLVGAAARELSITQPDRTVSWVKRWMGTNRTFTIDGREFTPQELSSLVLQSLCADAEATLQEKVTEAVITVPAYFNEHQREATRLAGTLAGLNVRRILNEPTAAALTYGLINKDGDRRLLIYDMGGGTLDVTILEVFEGILETTASAGESRLGGEDFTDRLVAHLLQQNGEAMELAELKTPHKVMRLRYLCEIAKRKLSTDDASSVQIPDAEGKVEESSPLAPVDAEMFQQISKDLVDRAMGPIERAMADAEISRPDIDEVILVGGATRMPLIQAAVSEKVGKQPLCNLNPDTVVALGAAIQAALIAEDAAMDDVVMTDVCPFTLGIEIVKEFGGQIRKGYYLPLIHRNTTIPVTAEQFVSTVYDNQTEILVRVFQGEARKVENNLLLGSLRVSEFPVALKGNRLPFALPMT